MFPSWIKKNHGFVSLLFFAHPPTHTHSSIFPCPLTEEIEISGIFFALALFKKENVSASLVNKDGMVSLFCSLCERWVPEKSRTAQCTGFGSHPQWNGFVWFLVFCSLVVLCFSFCFIVFGGTRTVFSNWFLIFLHSHTPCTSVIETKFNYLLVLYYFLCFMTFSLDKSSGWF